MQNNALQVFDRLFRELKFEEVLDNYALVVVYPEGVPSVRLDYVMTTGEGKQLQGGAPLPNNVFPIEDTWRDVRRLRAKLVLLRGV